MDWALPRTFRAFRVGAAIFNRLSESSRPGRRLQGGAPDCRHFPRSMKYQGQSRQANFSQFQMVPPGFSQFHFPCQGKIGKRGICGIIPFILPPSPRLSSAVKPSQTQSNQFGLEWRFVERSQLSTERQSKWLPHY